MHIQLHKLGGTWEDTNVSLAYAYVGCQDGKIQVVPLNQLAYKVACPDKVCANAGKLKRTVFELEFDCQSIYVTFSLFNA